MKISVITATYNSARNIPGVLDSIGSQSHADIEFIVVDGGSTDGTVELLKKSSLVSQLVSEPDQGIYDALNKGIRMATGDSIGFLHSDDLFASGRTVESIARAFSDGAAPGGAEPAVIYGDLVFVDQFDSEKITRYWKSRPFVPALLRRGWMPPHPTLFMRRQVYEKHGLYNIDLRCAADYDYILRVFSDPSISSRYLPEVITKMRLGGTSTGGVKNLLNKSREDYRVLKINNMPFPVLTLLAKNVTKLPQLRLFKINIVP